MNKDIKSRLIVISGPSGVGKSTICRYVADRIEDAFVSVSATTRPMGAGEVDGENYWYLSRDEFQKKQEQGLFLETAEVFGNLYGTPKDKIDQALEAGRIVILEIDVQGAKQVKAIYPDAKLIFILPPTEGELQKRINDRGREDHKTAEIRLSHAGTETAAAWQYYDNMVVNDNLQEAVDEIVTIIRESTGEKV